MFVHLHVHSNYSFCRGASKIEELVDAALARDMRAMALTDTNGVYGLIWFLQYASERGLRPIVGAELESGEERAVLLARNREGYATLCRLLSRRHLEAGFSPSQALCEDREHLFVLSDHLPLLEKLARQNGTSRLYLELGKVSVPSFDTPDGSDAFGYLREECYRGAERGYGELSEAVLKRLEHELRIIREKGFAPYFLVVQDIVRQSNRTCGRGSAAASLVSYCLGITHVEPIGHNLFFERFLNEGRSDPPDIDIDFPWDERDEILDYVFRKYGATRAAMISNQVGFRARAAVREVAKVYGLPEAEIKAVTQR